MRQVLKHKFKICIFLFCAAIVFGVFSGVGMSNFAAKSVYGEESAMEDIVLDAGQINNYNGMTVVTTEEGISFTGANLNIASSQFRATVGNRYNRIETKIKISDPDDVSMARFVFPVSPAIWIQFMNTGEQETSGVSLHENGNYVTATTYVEEFYTGGEITLAMDCTANTFSVNGTVIPFLSNYAEFDIPTFQDVNIQFTSGNNADAGVVVTQLRVASAPEEGNDISEWPYFDPSTDEEQDDKWIEDGATLVNVHGGVAVMTSDAYFKKVIQYNDGYQSRRGFVDISDFSVQLNAVTKNTINAVDFWLISEAGSTLCVRIENMGSGSSYNVKVFDYTRSDTPCLGILQGISSNQEDRGTYIISYDYADTKTLRVNGTAIPITTDPAVLADYPQGYKSVAFSGDMAKLAFGVQEDGKQHQDEMVVLSHINGTPLYDFYPSFDIDLSEPWAYDGGLELATTDAGLRVTAGSTGSFRLGYGESLDSLDKHDLKSFSAQLKGESAQGFTLALVLSGKSASTGEAISLRLELSGFGTDACTAAVKDGAGNAVSDAQAVTCEGCAVEYLIDEQTFAINDTVLTRTDGGQALSDFAFSNGTLHFEANAAQGDAFTLSELCGAPIAYYETAPNYEREVAPGHKPSDDFKYDPWNVGNLATPVTTEQGVSISFTGSWSGSWYDVPMTFTTRNGYPSSARTVLSAYITAGDANSGDNGIGVAFTSTDYDGPAIDETGSLRRTYSLVVHISTDGTRVTVMDENWVSLGGGSIMGSFTDPEKNGFLIEFDTQSCTLYVNGQEITGNYDKFAFKNNATYLGVFGSSMGTEASVTNVLLVNGEPLVEGAEIEMIEFPDVDEIRIEDQLDDVQITADENRDFSDTSLSYKEKYTVEVKEPLGAGWIVLIVAAGVLVAGGAVFGVLMYRRKRK